MYSSRVYKVDATPTAGVGGDRPFISALSFLRCFRQINLKIISLFPIQNPQLFREEANQTAGNSELSLGRVKTPTKKGSPSACSIVYTCRAPHSYLFL